MLSEDIQCKHWSEAIQYRDAGSRINWRPDQRARWQSRSSWNAPEKPPKSKTPKHLRAGRGVPQQQKLGRGMPNIMNKNGNSHVFLTGSLGLFPIGLENSKRCVKHTDRPVRPNPVSDNDLVMPLFHASQMIRTNCRLLTRRDRLRCCRKGTGPPPRMTLH